MEKVPTYTYILMYEQYVYLHYIADINFSFEQESQTTQSSRLAGIEEHERQSVRIILFCILIGY